MTQIPHPQPGLRDQIYVSFDLLARLPPAVANEVADQVIAGLILILQHHKDIVHSQTDRLPLPFAAITEAAAHPP